MSFHSARTRGGKSSSGGRGWAAFDREQRLKRQGLLENVVVEDPFPALPSKQKPTSSSSSSSPFSLPRMSSWSRGLIQNDAETSTLLRFDHSNSDNKQRHHVVVGSCSTESSLKHLDCDSTTPTAVSNDDDDDDDDDGHDDDRDVDGSADMEGVPVPIEPEWEDEDDDVYFTHRKRALRTMRTASQHSKAATKAYLRGDHVSAHQHSLKAHHQWLAAQTLHAKAAIDILAIRNSHNDVWKLDLHGLHAAEAIQVLQQHLHNIETKLVCSRSVSPNSLKMDNTRSLIRSNSLESFGCVEDEQQQASLKQRPTSLQVITGVGNHSRGQASLPAAVRGFLNENGYRFEELKPGVITVRPKFRLSS